MSKDINDFLFGGGGAAAKFESEGDMVSGTIISCELKPQTDMETGAELHWANGDTRMQLVVRLQTDERDSAREDDDGVRTVYAKGGNYEVDKGQGKSMKDAIADAVKKAGSRSLTEGGTLKVAFTGMGKKTNRGYSAPKLYTAQYKEPVSSVSADDLFGSD